MGFYCSNLVLFLLFISWGFFVSNTNQLQATQTQLLIQLRKHLEYPLQLSNWENFNGDFCNLDSDPQVTIKCEGNSVTEIKIMGDKLSKVSDFHGYAVKNQTLSETFSVDSLVVTLARLNTLRVLSLVSLGIWGPLPDKIHRLSSLELLDMSSNFMFGSIPNEISRLVKLHTLTLDGNFFNESIPNWLDSLSNLTILSLKNNRLKGQFPSSICKTTTLTDIALSHNNLTGELPDLSALSVLHLLDLRENGFDSELPLLPRGVTTVLLSKNSLKGQIPEEFGELDRLQHLDLSFNSLTGSPPSALFSLPNISYLNLASNMLNGPLHDISKCGDNLGFVDISSNRLTGRLPSCLDTNSSNKRVVKFNGNCLFGDNQQQNLDSICKEASLKKNRSWGSAVWIIIGVIGLVVILLVIIAFVRLFFRKRHHQREIITLQHTVPKVIQDSLPSGISSEVLANARVISEASKLGTQVAPSSRVFSIEELAGATDNFSATMFLGEGSIGKLYRGRLENGSYIVIRSLSLFKKYSIRNLKVRLDLLSKLRHPHLVGFLGYCINEEGLEDYTSSRVFLVHEYISNGNFRTHLSECSPNLVLKWSDRLAILIGIAKAVHFLHTGVIPASSSNRLRTNNILLDEHRIAKLSDYGMSIITEELEQFEVLFPLSLILSKLADDVYDFGFILLETLVGPIVTGKGESFLLNEMKSFGSQDGRQRIVDPIVLTTCSQESLSIVISITNKCISPEPANRPSFEDMLWNLQYAAQVQATADSEQKSDGAF
ncbi:probable inactive leucine-rich repeat receptor-like protein kinase At3g03770 isoform X2 [Cynara cardunculus var. scolymus]|uniref:probable inactive leucine-rich repeat receptor-like protein kinase At3g03770 isoform X2 n=1 Tax=Cynara cardunculus var. scolymus TaxID=59895 RepID=UPI000D62404B|nr:probable inactive leucine-rich repeat receptor-like protein kinase At3g03770 isoform X2 [Cynara cardunculus var. scolymus]